MPAAASRTSLDGRLIAGKLIKLRYEIKFLYLEGFVSAGVEVAL
jgi:hypothetical protein